MRRVAALTSVLASLVFLLVGCSDDTSSTGSASSDNGGAISGEVQVFAASSLTEAFTSIGEQFQREHPGTKVTFNFAASSELVQQVDAGAPADVLATADEKNMTAAVDAGNVDAASTFAKNRLAILVASGNPKGIRTVADLGRPGVSFVLCAPEVPCGRFGAAILDKAGVSAEPESEEANVKAAVTRVTSGEVDASLVYVTDAQAAGGQAEGVDIPEDINEVATYPIALVKDGGNREAAQAFIDAVQSEAGQKIVQDAGFDPAR